MLYFPENRRTERGC